MNKKKYSTDPQVKTWDRLWKAYNSNRFFKPNQRVVDVISQCFDHNLAGKKILELGAGSGCDIAVLTKAGAKGYAMDFSSESVQSIHYWARALRVRIRCTKTDISRIPYTNGFFDCVYSVGLMEHFRDPLPLLREQIRVIKSGGMLIIDVPQRYTLYTIAKHLRMRWGINRAGWETEYSRNDLLRLAALLGQKAEMIYGRDLDVIDRLNESHRAFFKNHFVNVLEKSRIAPYVCLCIGLVLRIK